MPQSTEWISALSDAVAAVGTVGALWVGALTLSQQVKDKHRAQASAVTVGNRPWKELTDIGDVKGGIKYFVTNNSPLPIYNVLLYSIEGRRHQTMPVLAPGGEVSFNMSTSDFSVIAKFADSAGVSWKRDGNGKLTELKSDESSTWTMD